MDYRPMIRDLPQSERPRERLRDFGAPALSTTELVAIILRNGSAGESVMALATRLLSRYEGLPGLARAGFSGDLTAERGLGEAKAAELKAALELGKRLAASSADERPVITSSRDVANLLLVEMGMLEQESLRTLLLNGKNAVLATSEVVRGSVNAAQVRVAELFREPVRRNAVAIILVHNHPSGDPGPSADDIAITKEAVRAGQLLGIEVLDHVIMGQGRYISMREHHIGFPMSADR